MRFCSVGRSLDQMALFFMAIVGSVTTLVVLASYDYITDTATKPSSSRWSCCPRLG